MKEGISKKMSMCIDECIRLFHKEKRPLSRLFIVEKLKGLGEIECEGELIKYDDELINDTLNHLVEKFVLFKKGDIFSKEKMDFIICRLIQEGKNSKSIPIENKKNEDIEKILDNDMIRQFHIILKKKIAELPHKVFLPSSINKEIQAYIPMEYKDQFIKEAIINELKRRKGEVKKEKVQSFIQSILSSIKNIFRI